MSLQTNDYSPSVKLKQPLTELTDKMRQVLARLVYGDPEKGGKPQSIAEIADQMSVRRAYVRDLMQDPLFKLEMAKATAEKRKAAHPMAVHAMVELLDWTGLETPADANVRLNAAKAVLGEEAKGVTVNVNQTTNVGISIKPGYVIRQPASKEPVTIEGMAQ